LAESLDGRENVEALSRAIVFALVTVVTYMMIGLAPPGSMEDLHRSLIALGAGLLAAFYGRQILRLLHEIDFIRSLFK
jgi:hypothetical protein